MEVFITVLVGVLAGMFGVAIQKPKVFFRLEKFLLVASLAVMILASVMSTSHNSVKSGIVKALGNQMEAGEALKPMQIASEIEPSIPYGTIVFVAFVILVWTSFCTWIAHVSKEESESEKDNK